MPEILDIQTNPDIGDRGLIDIYLPEGEGPFNFLLGIHGGGWHKGDRKKFSPRMPDLFNAENIAVVLCSYRMSDRAKYPAAYNDLIHLLKWLKQNGEEHKLIAEKCVITGGSAGGHLSGLIATKGIKEEKDIPEILGAALFCPVLSMETFYYSRSDPEVITNFMGGDKNELPDAYKDASPLHHLHKDIPPLWIAHGVEDNIVSVGVTREFAAKLNEMNLKHIYHEFPGERHGMSHVKPEGDEGPLVYMGQESFVTFVKECFE